MLEKPEQSRSAPAQTPFRAYQTLMESQQNECAKKGCQLSTGYRAAPTAKLENRLQQVLVRMRCRLQQQPPPPPRNPPDQVGQPQQLTDEAGVGPPLLSPA